MPQKIKRAATPNRSRIRQPEAGPDPLARIAQLSQNARTTWFGLLGVLAFVGITLLGHRDADFFATGAGTQLPLINISVPVQAFFATAPVLVAALYAYLHLYLLSLWDALADAPARVGGQPLSDRVFPWLLSFGALWFRNRARADGSASPRALGRTVVFISLFLGWLFGAFILAALWVRSMPAHNGVLTIWAGACFLFATLIGITGIVTMLRRMRGNPRARAIRANLPLRWGGALAAILIPALSWQLTHGGVLSYRSDGWVEAFRTAESLNTDCRFQPKLPEDQQPTTRDAEILCGIPPLYPGQSQDPNADKRFHPALPIVSARLSETRLTARPADWKSFELWLGDYRRARAGDIPDAPEDPGQDPLIPTAEEMQRWALVTQALDAPILKDRDLRNADLADAFAPGADFRGAVLAGVDLRRADLQGVRFERSLRKTPWNPDGTWSATNLSGADLREARMQGADLRDARMQGANLFRAEMQGADLSRAKMQGANLFGADMQGADLSGAAMQRVDLRYAKMREADLSYVKIQKANLSNARMRRANITTAQMQETDLSYAEMQGAYLSSARIQGANLRFAQMQGATLVRTEIYDSDCSGANFIAARAQSTNFQCLEGTLGQEQLDLTVGNTATKLPHGLYVWSCLDRGRDDVKAAQDQIDKALAEVPEGIREGFEELLYCNPQSERVLQRSEQKVRWRPNPHRDRLER